jgi:hypothetical protein
MARRQNESWLDGRGGRGRVDIGLFEVDMGLFDVGLRSSHEEKVSPAVTGVA